MHEFWKAEKMYSSFWLKELWKRASFAYMSPKHDFEKEPDCELYKPLLLCALKPNRTLTAIVAERMRIEKEIEEKRKDLTEKEK